MTKEHLLEVFQRRADQHMNHAKDKALSERCRDRYAARYYECVDIMNTISGYE